MLEQRDFLDQLAASALTDFRGMIAIGDEPDEARRNIVAGTIASLPRFRAGDLGRETIVAHVQRAIDAELATRPVATGLLVEGRFTPAAIAERFREAYRLLRSKGVDPAAAWRLFLQRIVPALERWEDQVLAQDVHNQVRHAIEREG